METIKVVLVDPDRLVREGIRTLLGGDKDIECIGDVAGQTGLVSILKKQPADIVITEISLRGPDGIELTQHITTEYTGVKVLILSAELEEGCIFNALKAGAKGYLTKNITKGELYKAIRKLHEGGEYFSDPVSEIIMKGYVNKAKKAHLTVEYNEEELSRREIEVLKLFAGGMKNKEIAGRLFVSIRTIESHKNHIMQKLELKNNVDLIKFAIKNKLVEL